MSENNMVTPVRIAEQSSAPTNVAATSARWVRDDTPNVPMHQTDDDKSHEAVTTKTDTITASTTQSQGQQPLTSHINRISVCANANDVVTMPPAAGTTTSFLHVVWVINDGANTLQIFPASGDDIGAGTDTSVTLATGKVRCFLAYSSTTYKEINATVLG